MRRVEIIRGDFPLFHQDVNPLDYEFFRTHSDAFKRMWQEQKRSFWSILVDTYDDFIWSHGVMKDFPLKIEDKRMYISDIIEVLRSNFVEGSVSTAKAIIMDCVILAQNRHHVSGLDKGSYSTNPFYMKDTRESFRKLFGPPKSKSTFIKLLCGIPVYVKFAGTIINVLRRWLSAAEIGDIYLERKYLEDLMKIRFSPEPIEAVAKVDKDQIKGGRLGNPGELEAMINELAPRGHQKDPDPALSNGSMEAVKPTTDTGSIPTTTTDKKKKKKKKAKPPKKEAASKKEEHQVSESQEGDQKAEQLLDLRNDPNFIVQKYCDSDILMPDGRLMKAPITFIAGKGKRPDPAVIKASWNKYKNDEMKMEDKIDLCQPDKVIVTDITDGVIEKKEDKTEGKIKEKVKPERTKETSELSSTSDTSKLRVLLHHCGNCGQKEQVPKTFKRCVKCRGSINPKYYCNKECQVADWKNGHRLEHKDDKGASSVLLTEADTTG